MKNSKLLFLGRPAYLYLNGFKEQSIKLFFYTLAFLVAITLIVFAIKIFGWRM